MADDQQYVFDDDSSPESHLGEPSSPPEPMIPKHRMDEVLKREQAAIKERDDLKRQLTERETPAEPPTYSEDDLQAIDRRVRDLPAFREMHEWKQQQEQERQAVKDAFLRKTETKLATYAEELGVPKDNQGMTYEVHALVAEKIRQDPHLAARFRQNDESVVDEAFQRLSSEGLISGLRRKGKAAVASVKRQGPQPPRDVARAVPPEKKEEAAPQSERDIWDRAHDRAWERASAAVGEE